MDAGVEETTSVGLDVLLERFRVAWIPGVAAVELKPPKSVGIELRSELELGLGPLMETRDSGLLSEPIDERCTGGEGSLMLRKLSLTLCGGDGGLVTCG